MFPRFSFDANSVWSSRSAFGKQRRTFDEGTLNVLANGNYQASKRNVLSMCKKMLEGLSAIWSWNNYWVLCTWWKFLVVKFSCSNLFRCHTKKELCGLKIYLKFLFLIKKSSQSYGLNCFWNERNVSSIQYIRIVIAWVSRNERIKTNYYKILFISTVYYTYVFLYLYKYCFVNFT